MDPAILEGFLKAIRDAVSGHRRDDDVALPVFDPATSDHGAQGWCNSIEELSKELGWSSITTVARAAWEYSSERDSCNNRITEFKLKTRTKGQPDRKYCIHGYQHCRLNDYFGGTSLVKPNLYKYFRQLVGWIYYPRGKHILVY